MRSCSCRRQPRRLPRRQTTAPLLPRLRWTVLDRLACSALRRGGGRRACPKRGARPNSVRRMESRRRHQTCALSQWWQQWTRGAISTWRRRSRSRAPHRQRRQCSPGAAPSAACSSCSWRCKRCGSRWDCARAERGGGGGGTQSLSFPLAHNSSVCAPLHMQVQLLEQRVAALQLTPPAAAVPVLACATVPWGVLPWLTSVQPPAAQWQPIAGAASSVEPSACAGRVEEWQPPSSRGSSRCSQQWVAPVSLEAVPCPAAAEGDTLDRLLDDAERAASALSCHSSLPDAYQTPSDACTQQPAPARQARVAVVARARVPSPLLLLSWEGGAPADDSDEDERLEQKYGLVRRRGVQPDWMMVRVRRSRGAGGNRV